MKKLIPLLSFFIFVFLSCSYESYDVVVKNESGFPVIFQFETGHQIETLRLEPNKEWRCSLLTVFTHKMISLKAFNSDLKVSYKYSDNIYTIQDVYTITFNINGAYAKGEKFTNFTQEFFADFEGLLPGDEGYRNGLYRFNGWNGNNTGTSPIQFDKGIHYSMDDIASKLSAAARATWEQKRTLTLYIKWDLDN